VGELRCRGTTVFSCDHLIIFVRVTVCRIVTFTTCLIVTATVLHWVLVFCLLYQQILFIIDLLMILDLFNRVVMLLHFLVLKHWWRFIFFAYCIESSIYNVLIKIQELTSIIVTLVICRSSWVLAISTRLFNTNFWLLEQHLSLTVLFWLELEELLLLIFCLYDSIVRLQCWEVIYTSWGIQVSRTVKIVNICNSLQ